VSSLTVQEQLRQITRDAERVQRECAELQRLRPKYAHKYDSDLRRVLRRLQRKRKRLLG
jgi:hypothetical protein